MTSTGAGSGGGAKVYSMQGWMCGLGVGVELEQAGGVGGWGRGVAAQVEGQETGKVRVHNCLQAENMQWAMMVAR